MNERPKVGIGVLIVKDEKILLGKRKNAHGEGSWCPAGGHLEYAESWEECAKREALEETGVEISNVRFAYVGNDIFKEDAKHYVTIIMIAEYALGEPRVCESDKCEEWRWFSWDELPSPLFLSLDNAIQKGFNLYDHLLVNSTYTHPDEKDCRG